MVGGSPDANSAKWSWVVLMKGQPGINRVHGSDIVWVICVICLWVERSFLWLLEVTVQGHKVLWDVVCNRGCLTETEDEQNQEKCNAKKEIERMEEYRVKRDQCM